MDKIVTLMDGLSGAEIKAVCTEAGYFAIREDRQLVHEDDFKRGVVKVKEEEFNDAFDYMNMFG